MVADSTHRSPQVPSTHIGPLHFHISTVPSATDLSPVPSKYNEADYPQDDNSGSNSDDNDEQDTDPIPMPDLVHMPQKENENEEIPQEEIPHIEQQNERPQTPGPSNPSHDNTQPINPEFPNNDRPKQEIPDDPPQTTNINSDTNSALTNFVQSPTFHKTMKRMTLQVGEDTFNRIAQNPRLVKDWILQVIHRFHGLLDDLTDNTLEYVNTDNGPIRILQPTTSQNPQPRDQQDHETSQVKEVAPPPSYTDQAQQENNNAPTIPSSTSPDIISSEDSDSEDCVIEKVSPGPKIKYHKRYASPPDVPSPQVIVKRYLINKEKGATQSQQHLTSMDIQLHTKTLDLTITGHRKDPDYRTKHNSLQLLQALLQNKDTKTKSTRNIRKTNTKTRTTRLLHDF